MNANEHHARSLLQSLIAAGVGADGDVATSQIEQWALDASLDKDDLDAALGVAAAKGWLSPASAGKMKLTRSGFDSASAGQQDA